MPNRILTGLFFAKKRILDFLIAKSPGSTLRAVFFRLAGGKCGKKIFLGRNNCFNDFSKVFFGDRTIIGENNVFASRGGIKLGKNVLVSGYSFFMTQGHDLQQEGFQSVFKPITVDDNAWICTNSIILQGIKIGKAAVVGAGAVITKDVPDFEIWAGNPAKKIGKRSKKNVVDFGQVKS